MKTSSTVRLRTMLSTLSIGVSVTLILTLVGLSFGLSEESQHRQAGVGADIVDPRFYRFVGT